MQQDVINFSKKLKLIMTNIGDYVDNNMLIIQSIEHDYFQLAHCLKELLVKKISNLNKNLDRFPKFRGNKLYLDAYIEKKQCQLNLAKKAFETIKSYIGNDAIETKLYQKFNSKFLKTALETIFKEILEIEKPDFNKANDFENKTTVLPSTSIPNDFYDICLSMVVYGSCEYIESFVIERLSKLAQEILNITYEKINDRYAKMIEEISIYFPKELEPIKLNFKIDENLNEILSTQRENCWNPSQTISNKSFIENTECQQSFSNYLREKVSIIPEPELKTTISESIKNEEFEINNITMYLKTFQNDLKNEIIKKGHICALELISAHNIINPMDIIDNSSNNNTEKKDQEQKSSLIMRKSYKVNQSESNSINSATKEGKVNENEEDRLSKSVPMDYSTKNLLNTTLTENFKNINVEEISQKSDETDQNSDETEQKSIETEQKSIETEQKSIENTPNAEIIENFEKNSKLPNNLIIGNTYKILKKFFNTDSEAGESTFNVGDLCVLLGVEDYTNICRVKLLRLNKEDWVPMNYIVEEDIPSKLEENKTNYVASILKSQQVESKEQSALNTDK